jgi:hypothetical protein
MLVEMVHLVTPMSVVVAVEQVQLVAMVMMGLVVMGQDQLHGLMLGGLLLSMILQVEVDISQEVEQVVEILTKM